MPSIEQLEQRWLRQGARDDQEFENFLARRRGGEPMHRILGWREFWGLKFFLSPETLEPRPDSETMIEVLIKMKKNLLPLEGGAGEWNEPEGVEIFPQSPPPSCYARHLPPQGGGGSLRILDMGTGTGCLLLAALSEFPNAKGVGIDAAAGAISTAQKNAAHLGLASRAEFKTLNWHDTNALHQLGSFDIILANPPYIPHADIQTLQTEVREYDPIAALDGGTDGLEPYRHITAQLPHLLKPDGLALFEIGHDQAAAVHDILHQAGFHPSHAYKDLGGNDRIIAVTQENTLQLTPKSHINEPAAPTLA